MLCLGLGNYQKIDVTVFQNCLKFILFREFWNISNKPNYAFSLYIYFYLFIFYFYFFYNHSTVGMIFFFFISKRPTALIL